MNATPERQRLRLGNYEPLIELASGGMATVYVARQVGAAGFERLVVIKRVHRHHLGNREFYRMFLDEAHIASLVRHPNVVPVIDAVEQDGELFLVMEYVESVALSSLLKSAVEAKVRVPVPIASRVLADTLAGLHAAHEAVDMRGNALQLVHRDVSPQNVIIGVDGTSRLIDFGIAKAAHRLTETRSGSLKGKLAYMSPEQAMGDGVDRRVDIFAAGVALHETLTGRRLFQGENDLDTMRRITEMPVPDPSSLAPGIPKAVDAVVQRALHRDPALRFQTAAAFLDALEEAIPPAPAREVTSFVLARCRERIEERRAQLKAVVEGTIEPLSMRLVPTYEEKSNESTRLPPAARRRAAESESQISQVIAASTRDATVPPPKGARARGWGAKIVGGLAAMMCLGGVALWVARHGAQGTAQERKAAPVVATSASAAASVAAAPASVTRKAEKTDEIELTVRADAPLVGVYAPGSKRVEIEGNRATLVVPPWTGSLPIDAVLAGNRQARAVAAEGTREVRVVPVPASPEKGRPARPVSPAGGAPAPKRGELQDNPYQ